MLRGLTPLAQAMERAILYRCNRQTDLITPAAKEFAEMSLLEMARYALQMNGMSTQGMSRHDIAMMAMTARDGGMASTSDFPSILANTFGKLLRQAYQQAPQTFSSFVRRVAVKDFKQV